MNTLYLGYIKLFVFLSGTYQVSCLFARDISRFMFSYLGYIQLLVFVVQRRVVGNVVRVADHVGNLHRQLFKCRVFHTVVSCLNSHTMFDQNLGHSHIERLINSYINITSGIFLIFSLVSNETNETKGKNLDRTGFIRISAIRKTKYRANATD